MRCNPPSAAELSGSTPRNQVDLDTAVFLHIFFLLVLVGISGAII